MLNFKEIPLCQATRVNYELRLMPICIITLNNEVCMLLLYLGSKRKQMAYQVKVRDKYSFYLVGYFIPCTI